MEDTLQRVFSILLSVMIFFLLPLYMAFEKKDDISYSLALKITSNFVDEVCNKGYMTIDMYNDFVSDLTLTGNSYDISLEHIAKVYEPVIYAYNNNKQYNFDYQLYKNNVSNSVLEINGVDYTNPTLSYKVSNIRYTTDQILAVMDQDAIKPSEAIINKIEYEYDDNDKQYKYGPDSLVKLDAYKNVNKNDILPFSGLYRTTSGKTIYPMNKGDRISVVIKNTNVTIASMLFNTITFGAKTGVDTKVYINYGGTIENEEYRYTIIDTTVTEEAVDINGGQTTHSLDIDGDGEIIREVDAELIKRYVAGQEINGLTEEMKEKMNVNGDDVINVADWLAWVNAAKTYCEENGGHNNEELELYNCRDDIKDECGFVDGVYITVNRLNQYTFPPSVQIGKLYLKTGYTEEEYIKINGTATGSYGTNGTNYVYTTYDSILVDVCKRCGTHEVQ